MSFSPTSRHPCSRSLLYDIPYLTLKREISDLISSVSALPLSSPFPTPLEILPRKSDETAEARQNVTVESNGSSARSCTSLKNFTQDYGKTLNNTYKPKTEKGFLSNSTVSDTKQATSETKASDLETAPSKKRRIFKICHEKNPSFRRHKFDPDEVQWVKNATIHYSEPTSPIGSILGETQR